MQTSNKRSQQSLAILHELSGLSTYGLNGHRKRDEYPAYDPQGHGLVYIFTVTTALLAFTKSKLN